MVTVVERCKAKPVGVSGRAPLASPSLSSDQNKEVTWH